jgi:hypothetical protein
MIAMIRGREREIHKTPAEEDMAEGGREAEAGLERVEAAEWEGTEAGMAEKATKSGRRCTNSSAHRSR